MAITLKPVCSNTTPVSREGHSGLHASIALPFRTSRYFFDGSVYVDPSAVRAQDRSRSWGVSGRVGITGKSGCYC